MVGYSVNMPTSLQVFSRFISHPNNNNFMFHVLFPLQSVYIYSVTSSTYDVRNMRSTCR